MSTLWQEEEIEQICSRESLMENKSTKGNALDVDPTMFNGNRFWNRRHDGTVTKKYHRALYILEFKRSSNRNENFLGLKEDEANEQRKSIMEALKAAAPEWTLERIIL